MSVNTTVASLRLMTSSGFAPVTNLELLDSALHAPQAGFGDVEFYPEFVDKAAVLVVRIARNHPLPDGNKRLAWQPSREPFAADGRGRVVGIYRKRVEKHPPRSDRACAAAFDDGPVPGDVPGTAVPCGLRDRPHPTLRTCSGGFAAPCRRCVHFRHAVGCGHCYKFLRLRP